MCGIAGIIYRNGGRDVGRDMTRMLQSMKHRGPDSTGYALFGPRAHGYIMRFKLADANDPRDFEFADRIRRNRHQVMERLRRIGAQVHELEEDSRERPDEPMPEVGAVKGDDERAAADRQRRPAAQPVVGVDDVEPTAGRRAPKPPSGPQIRGCSGREGRDLHLDAAEATESLHLIADERSVLGPRLRRPHVGDDQDAHRRQSIATGP